jgi:hypothetical protein
MALFFMLSLSLFYKHCFSALTAVLLLLLPCLLYLFLYNTHLGKLRFFPAPLSEPFFDHPTLLLYKHPG